MQMRFRHLGWCRSVRWRLGRHGAAREGVVKLLCVERDEGVAGCGVALIGVVSANRGKADYVVPGGEACGHFPTVGIGAESVASGTEVG
jgi:hypothetical protein